MRHASDSDIDIEPTKTGPWGRCGAWFRVLSVLKVLRAFRAG
jgi:hypothetical protein